VGGIADQAARRLAKDGKGRMFCIVGLGGKVPSILETTGNATKIVTIDGCPLDCTKNSLLEAGFRDFHHVRLYDMGMKKTETKLTEENISKAYDAAAKFLDEESV
jgi:uncharacterized metal-binding protein